MDWLPFEQLDRLRQALGALPFIEAVASRDKTVLRYGGDVGVALRHVGAPA